MLSEYEKVIARVPFTCMKMWGFVETGRIPRKHFKENQYIDEVIMTKLIE